MNEPTGQRKTERYFILAIAAVLLLFFVNLFFELKKEFPAVTTGMQNKTVVHLNQPDRSGQLTRLLQSGFYLEDGRDIAFIGTVLSRLREEPLDNIGALNKHPFLVSAEEAFARGGNSFQKRVRQSRAQIGFTGADSLRYEQEKKSPLPYPAQINAGMGKYSISGSISDSTGNAVPGVLVRLEMILPQDSLYQNSITEISGRATEQAGGFQKTYINDSTQRQLQSLVGYCRTDAAGEFSFAGLPDEKAFAVLPLQPGYQFGSAQGTARLGKNTSLDFVQRPHSLRIFSTRDFNNLKKDGAVVVRTPEEFSTWYWIIVVVFLLLFFLVHAMLGRFFPAADPILLPVVMLLTGLSFLTLLSLQDPLRDRFLARSTLFYFAGGMLLLMLLQFFDLKKFTTDSGLYRLFALKTKPSAASGWPWGVLAIVLLISTILFGRGPEGSGVKVNLFGFQPSEVVKFLIVLFLSGFLALHETFIAQYSTWQRRWNFFRIALFLVASVILLFLMVGDLGPAVVCCFTFIILFSFARGDFSKMAGSVLFYVLLLWIVPNIWLATAITAAVFAGVVLFHWKMLSESSVMAMVVIAAFLLLDQVPFLDDVFPGPVQRLIDRKAIWQNNWDNEVFGGDHVANGIWAISGGGVWGQGMGEGFAKTIPEAHTDMILPSLGEDLGWMGIVAVSLMFLLLLHRSILIGRQTGRPFLFYVCAGIGVATFIQFVLIAGGSTGAVPLSGVALPLMSYGGSSLILNLAAAGFLLSASGVSGSEVQTVYIRKQQDHNLVPALLTACVALLLLLFNVSRYSFARDPWIVRPALVADRSGARMFSYNPRISLFMNRLDAGTLFDRNGRVLATGSDSLLQQQQDSLVATGVPQHELAVLLQRRLDRKYPYAAQMFFWTGDANTGIFQGSTNGYFAEYEHAAELRGFPMPVSHYYVAASRYREERFLPPRATQMAVSRRDYTALAPLIAAGWDSKAVERLQQKDKDVFLTVDAALQVDLQNRLQVSELAKGKRVSVVVMEDYTGDVLASALFPLPVVESWDGQPVTGSEESIPGMWVTNRDLGFTHATQPGSTAKIATALAAFNKMGMNAAQQTFLIRPEDRIRIRSDEPDEAGTIGMQRAIVNSNNPYFIRLANELSLQEEMVTVYLQTGMFLRGVGGYFFEGSATPNRQAQWRSLWRNTEFRSSRWYRKEDLRRTRGVGISGMAWGQGELVATPASICRLATAISNNGWMVPNRYAIKAGDSLLPVKKPVAVARDSAYAAWLTRAMLLQSMNKTGVLGLQVAGKTGTPERIFRGRRINDGWYVFFAPRKNTEGHIAVCIRIEGAKGSSEAVQLAGTVVIPALLQKNYIASFGRDVANAPAP